MTTPAISRDERPRTLVEEWITTPLWGTPESLLPPKYYAYLGWIRESRPASHTSVKSPSGWRMPTAWNHLKVDWRVDSAAQAEWANDPYHWHGIRAMESAVNNSFYHSLPAVPSWMTDTVVNNALIKLQSQFGPNLSQDVAEYEQTARMFESSAGITARKARELRKRYPKDWEALARGFSRNPLYRIPDWWLEYVYGVRPLVEDLYGACEEIRKQNQQLDQFRTTVRSSITQRVTQDLNLPCGNFGGFKGTAVIDMSARCSLTYTLDNPFIASLSSLGILNPVSLGWEITRYSFVVDSFLPIGNFLQGLTADFGWKFLGGSLTTFVRAPVVEMTRYGVKNSGIMSRWIDTPSCSWGGFSMDRSVFTTSPWPRLPHFRNPLSPGNIANAMSLLVQAFK